jgi:hypothetical protein
MASFEIFLPQNSWRQVLTSVFVLQIRSWCLFDADMVQFVGAEALQFERHVSVIQSQFIATALRVEYWHLLRSSSRSSDSERKL